MFCAVKAIDREGRDTVRCFQYTFDFYLGQISVTEAIFGSLRGSCPGPQFTIRGPGKLNFVVNNLTLLSSLPTIFCIKGIAKKISLF